MLRVLLLLSSFGPLAAQELRFTNAQLERRAVQGSLTAELRAPTTTPRWIAWSVTRPPAAPASFCYWENASLPRTAYLEGAPRVVILVRLDPFTETKIRAFPSDCEIDAGGLAVTLFEGVAARDSLQVLEPYLKEPEDRARSALRAIAAHADPEADEILERTARDSTRLRRTAIALLGSHRGARGFEFLSRQPISTETISAIGTNADTRAVPWLIEKSKSAPTPAARKDAVRALTRSRDRRAMSYLEELAAR
ncbi:MAG: hypothetical protein K2Q23_11855 [Bryobacteraceae bacterium]|nr:hypothetical protein [Bryobacteraceae bacterium]